MYGLNTGIDTDKPVEPEPEAAPAKKTAAERAKVLRKRSDQNRR